jgi:hypothetical protein
VAAKLVPFALLTGASVVTLPVLYALVRPDLDDIARPTALGLGALSMGLAWAAGVSLEDRRKGSVVLLCALAVLSPLVGVAPPVLSLVGASGIALLSACAALSLVGLVLLQARWRA